MWRLKDLAMVLAILSIAMAATVYTLNSLGALT